MGRERKLLVDGVIAIMTVAAVPAAYDAWLEQRRAQSNEDFIAAKDREIACLDALLKKGVPKEMDAAAEIERCRRSAIEE